MESTYEKEEKQLIFRINEDIDECCVQKIRRKLDNEIERYMPKKVLFDFSNVSFMDSAGIGLLIGRYKLANMLGGEVQVTNINTPIRKIFEMSGILRIIPEVENAKREPAPNFEKREPAPIFAKREPAPIFEKREPTPNYDFKEVQYEQNI